MTAEEIAMKFQSASTTCCGDKCPYRKECQGTYETCRIKEVALVLRSQIVELEKLRAERDALSGATKLIARYCTELENINAAYYRIISRFQTGFRSSVRKYKKRTPHIGSGRGRKKKSLIEMDGDERYAMPEEPKPPKDPVVVL